jgi:hypothetical protein
LWLRGALAVAADGELGAEADGKDSDEGQDGRNKKHIHGNLPGCVVWGPKAGDLVVCLGSSKGRAKLSGLHC